MNEYPELASIVRTIEDVARLSDSLYSGSKTETDKDEIVIKNEVFGFDV